MERGPRQVRVLVRDDGVGFDPHQISLGSHGLADMRHRLRACGAEPCIDTRPGDGTEVSAVIPHTP